MKNKWGRIVSLKKHKTAKKEKCLGNVLLVHYSLAYSILLALKSVSICYMYMCTGSITSLQLIQQSVHHCNALQSRLGTATSPMTSGGSRNGLSQIDRAKHGTKHSFARQWTIDVEGMIPVNAVIVKAHWDLYQSLHLLLQLPSASST